MATGGAVLNATTHGCGKKSENRRPQSLFELPPNFFDSCRLLPPGKHLIPAENETLISTSVEKIDQFDNEDTIKASTDHTIKNRWSCNTCKSEFDSLIDQRSHFKSDLHRFNVKLSLAGKDILKEEDLDMNPDSFLDDFDVSSISGSEDEHDRSRTLNSINEILVQSAKQKIFVRLNSGEKVSVWKSLILSDSKTLSCENVQFVVVDNNGAVQSLREVDVIEKLKVLTHETRDNTNLRIILLASGGHFAGCVFDGNTVVAHKTFHRYVVRAKAGKTQSSKDGSSGRSIHSAGASIRRYNELALKKSIQELLVSWKPYFDASLCVFIYAPSSNRQMFYNGETPLFSNQHCDVKSIPFSVRRPTLKEARRIYSQLSQVTFEIDQEVIPDVLQLSLNESSVSNTNSAEGSVSNEANIIKGPEACEAVRISVEQSLPDETVMGVICTITPLHEAAKSGNVERVLELLEQGSDPTLKDERGRTPYMMATDKEVRNTFRRFMASNLEKWDWHAANVPSPLTKEMEESQNAKQAEKDAKRKAKAKELKKLRKEREKKAQANTAVSQSVPSASQAKSAASSSNARSTQSGSTPKLSKEEELKRKLIEDREKRAAAAERRMAMAASATGPTDNPPTSSTSVPPSGASSDIVCSCCNASLVGKVPFHRYNYKYCSTTCMNVHRQFLEDG